MKEINITRSIPQLDLELIPDGSYFTAKTDNGTELEGLILKDHARPYDSPKSVHLVFNIIISPHTSKEERETEPVREAKLDEPADEDLKNEYPHIHEVDAHTLNESYTDLKVFDEVPEHLSHKVKHLVVGRYVVRIHPGKIKFGCTEIPNDLARAIAKDLID